MITHFRIPFTERRRIFEPRIPVEIGVVRYSPSSFDVIPFWHKKLCTISRISIVPPSPHALGLLMLSGSLILLCPVTQRPFGDLMPKIWDKAGKLIGSIKKSGSAQNTYDEHNQPLGAVTKTGTYDATKTKI